jgi:hypothetical protein
VKQNILVGKDILSVWLARDNQAIKFVCSGGAEIFARTDGDCCSQSWIEGIDDPSVLRGTVISAEDVDMPELDYDHEEHECLRFYGFRIRTTRGVCTIDYRNSSNGYYGGSLEWPDDEYFYGGVHGQNVSKEEWVPVKP